MPENVKMSKLAIRGGARTFSFPRNWYSHNLRHGEGEDSLQGWMGWKYGYAMPNRNVYWYKPSKDKHQGGLTLAGFNVADSSIFPFISASGNMHPHVNAGNWLNVIRWKAPMKGLVKFFTSVNTLNHGGGNGIIYWLGRMGTDGGPANAGNRIETICGNEIKGPWSPQGGHISQRPPFETNEKSLFVQAGDTFYMVVGPNSQPNYDTVKVKWDINYEPMHTNVANLKNTSLSLREMTEDMARTQVVMPNYRHGQTKDAARKFSDRGESKDVSMGDWVDTTWIPEAVNRSYIYDSAAYNHNGNGSIALMLYQSPVDRQWWNEYTFKKRGRDRTGYAPGVVTNVMFQLRNQSPPPGVTFLNNIEGSWQTGGYLQSIKNINPSVKGPTSVWSGVGNHPWTVFTGLVGGSYNLDYEIYWETYASKAAGKVHKLSMDSNSCLKPNNIRIESGLIANYPGPGGGGFN